jgi:hypothetical protein
MAQTRRHRKQGRWGRETARREAPLDEVPAPGVTRISLPEHTVPASQLPVTAESATLARTIEQLQRRLRRARWVPWQRRRRPELQAQIDELKRQWRAMRTQRSAHGPQRW